MFCAGPEGHFDESHECVGDSGAPFVMMENERPVLAGITSWGYGCQRGRPLGIHTKVTNIVSWIVNKAIDMGAHMTSARQRNREDREETVPVPDIRIGIIKNAGKVKSVKKTQRQRRKKVKKRQNLKDQLRKENLERKFVLKMTHKGQPVDTKKLKKFLKSNVKRNGRNKQTYLKSSQLKKLRTVSSATPVFTYNACSISGYTDRYGSEEIERIRCLYRNDNFECSFKCLQDNMQPNAVLRCRNNQWYETYIKDTKSICAPMDSIKLSKIRKLSSSSSHLSRRHQNQKSQQSQPQLIHPDTTLKSSKSSKSLNPCFSGTVKEGMDQFNQLYKGELTAGNCRLKSNGGFECSNLVCTSLYKIPSANSARCVNGRWTPKKIRCKEL